MYPLFWVLFGLPLAGTAFAAIGYLLYSFVSGLFGGNDD